MRHAYTVHTAHGLAAIWKYLLQRKESLRGVSLFMKFYVGWRSDSGVTERKREVEQKRKGRKKNRRETRGTKRRRKTRVRVRALGDRNCRRRKKSEGDEADEKECEERNVGGFQRRTRSTVAPPRRSYRSYRCVSSRGFNRTDFHPDLTVTPDHRIAGYWAQPRN